MYFPYLKIKTRVFVVCVFIIAVTLYQSTKLKDHRVRTQEKGIQFLYLSRSRNGIGTDKRSFANPGTKGESIPSGECPLPKLDPYDPEVMKFMGTPDDPNCVKDVPLMFYTDLKSNLIINGTISSHGYLDCCYKEILRAPGIDDDKYVFSATCHPISSSKTEIPANKEFIGVFCCQNKFYNYKLMDVFGFVNLKLEVEDRIKRFSLQTSAKAKDKDSDFVNIVLFVIDSVSHMSFLRTMPKTRDYITKNLSAVSMDGYNSVGANSFPNAMAAFCGTTFNDVCASKQYYDNCPFIWKNLSAMGYRTMYGEDGPGIGTFNFAAQGFHNIPTDYYLRPLMLTVDNWVWFNYCCVPCHGPRLALEILLDQVKKAAVTFRNDKKYFQLLWSNTLSHDDINGPKLADDLLLETISWLHQQNFLNKTVFILMSDHGFPKGPLVATPSGSMEHRMPFVYSIFPKWFSQKYSSAVANLKMNSQRMSTPFDLHKTLLDLAQLEEVEDAKIHQRMIELRQKLKSPTFPRGISLFLEIPPNRNCQQAGVPHLYCSCYNSELVSNVTENMVSAGKAIVESINKIVSPYPQCSLWKFEKILAAQELWSTAISPNSKSITSLTAYIISVITMPSEASFKAIVFPNEQKWIVSEEILRISTYGNQSYCVDDKILKPFCYCSSFLKNA